MRKNISVLSIAILVFISVFLIDINVHAEDEVNSFDLYEYRNEYGYQLGASIIDNEKKFVVFAGTPNGSKFDDVKNNIGRVLTVSKDGYTGPYYVGYGGVRFTKDLDGVTYYFTVSNGVSDNGPNFNFKDFFNAGDRSYIYSEKLGRNVGTNDEDYLVSIFTENVPLKYVYDDEIPVAPLKDKQQGFTWSNYIGPDGLGECLVTARWDDTEPVEKYSGLERRIQINYDLCDLKNQLVLNATKPEYDFVIKGFHPYTYEPYDGVPFSDLKFSRGTPQFLEDFDNTGHAIKNPFTSRGAALAFRFRDTYFDEANHTVYYGPWYVIQSNEIDSGPFFHRFKFNYGIPLINTYQCEASFTNAGKISDTTGEAVGDGSYGDYDIVVNPNSVDTGIISTGSGLTPADAENNAAYNAGVDAENENQSVNNGAHSLKETLQSLIEMIGSFPQLIAAVYSFLPNWALIFATVMFCSLPTIAFIKFIKG